MLLDEALGERSRNTAALVPAVDVTESEDRYLVAVEAPGISKDDVEVELHDGVLTVRGEKKSERGSSDTARWTERIFGSFSRSFALPPDVDSERVDASFRDGVLHIKIEKRPEAKPRTVVIKG
jgi:HSP20 family protein